MTALSLAFDVLARNRASGPINEVGDSLDKTAKKGSRFGEAMKAGLAAAGVAAVAFGKSSVGAYVEAEQSSNRLDVALAKYPKTADVSRSALDKLNAALARKTKFDDDATASGQAVLAQFGLTGAQITELTPLLQDYAAKTGKDLPAAAQALGKATLGQGRALKDVGINFKDTGSAAGNLDVITAGLRKQVGGFAESEGKTAAGQAAILENQFGELQEEVGGRLVPVLTALAQRLLTAIDFFNRNRAVLVPLIAVLGTLTGAVLAVNAATRVAAAVQAAWTTVTGLFTTTKTAEGVVIARGTVARVAHRVATIAASVATGAWSAVTTAATAVRNLHILAILRSTVATVAHRVAVTAASVATRVWAAGQLLLNIALSANPIGLVVVAVAALAAGVVIAYKKSDTFRAIVDKLWSSIKSAWEWLGKFVSKMRDFKVPGWVKDLKDAFGGLTGAFKGAGSAVGGLFNDGPGIGGQPEGGQPRGVKQMMAALPKGTRLISGFRPGAITATGNPSYHGKGRAVDLPPSAALFEYIRARFGKVSKELIFSPAGGRQIHNGQPHYYKGVTRANHFDHVHWAMDRGGLARGIGWMPKLTSKPERVLSPQQTESFDRLVDQMGKGTASGLTLIHQGDVRVWDGDDYGRRQAAKLRDALAVAGV